MSGLNASLAIATQSLLTQEAELQVANNNIANANTPGYARETVVLTEATTLTQSGVTLGEGVTLQGFSSVRDELLDLRIQQQSGQQSSADAQAAALNQVQTLFPTSGASLGTAFSTFFTSLSALSATPASGAARQTVLSSAQDLASQFHSISSGLSGEQSSLNGNLVTDVTKINQISAQIAGLNQQIGQLSSSGADSGPLQDQVGQLELQLSKLTNISVTHTEGGDTLTTGNGTPLVLGGQSYALHTSANGAGLAQVYDGSGTDITSAISSGDLGGTLQTRDTAIPGLLNQLDTLANQFATAFNAAQASGYDQQGNQGAPLFSVSGSTAGSAASIGVLLTDPSAIAASSDGSSGSNGNVANLVAVQTATLPAGTSPTNASAKLVYQVGQLTSQATTESSAIGLSLSQLTQQQSSVSGVSIDEESANLIQYQQAYQAAAKVISTIATLFNTTLNMGSS